MVEPTQTEFLGYFWQSHNNPNLVEPFHNIFHCPLGSHGDGVYWVGEQISDSISCVGVTKNINPVNNTADYIFSPVQLKFVSFSISDSDNVMSASVLKNYLNLYLHPTETRYDISFNSSLIFDLYTKVDMLDNSLYNVFNVPLLDSKNGYKDMTSYHPLRNKNVSLFLTFASNEYPYDLSQTYKCTIRGDWTPDRDYLRNYNYLTA